MELQTLQQLIEQRAEKQLEKDLVDASNKEKQIQQKIGCGDDHNWLYEPKIQASFSRGDSGYFRADNRYTEELKEKLLPKYIAMITAEVLRKIDEIDYLVSQNKVEEDY